MSDQTKGSRSDTRSETRRERGESGGNPEGAPTAYPPRDALLAVAGGVAHYPPCSKIVYEGRVLYSNEIGGWIDYGPADPLPPHHRHRPPPEETREEVLVVVS